MQEQQGINIQVRAIVRGLSEDTVSMLATVFNSTHLEDVWLRDAIIRLLTFNPVEGVAKEVRHTMATVIHQIEGTTEELIRLARAYAEVENVAAFLEFAGIITKNLTTRERVSLLGKFHLMMRSFIPKLADIVERIESEK